MSANFNWSQFQPVENEPKPNENIRPSSENKFDWSQFEPTQQKDQYKKDQDLIWDDSSDIERGVERGTAMATSRILEGALGTPGNIQSAIKGITGLQLGSQLPTTSDIKQFSEKATREYTKPQSKFEKEGGEIASDIGSMLVPGASSYSFLRNIGIPITGWMAKTGIENLGGGEGASNAAKIATMVGLDLASAYRSRGRGGAKNYAKELWKEAEDNVPKGVALKTGNLSSELQTLKSQMLKGGDSPSVTHAVKKIDELIEASKSGKVPVDELMAFRKKINNLIEAQGGFDFTTHPTVRQQSIYNLNQVKDKVIGKLNEYAKVNAEFGVPYKQSNEAYSAYHASNYISNFLKKKFGEYLKSPMLYGLFGGGIKTLATAAAGAALPYHSVKLIHRVYRSPVLRELYGNVIKGAIENNASMTAKNLSELKKELEKKESIPKSSK